jgi:methyl-accepting chemotaxis protein
MSITPSRPPGSVAAHKRSVRNYLLDAHFQLKYAGILVSVAVAICGVMGVVLYQTTTSVVRESSAFVEESKKVSEVSRMNVHDLASDSPALVAEFSREAEAHDKSIADEQAMLLRRQQETILSLVGGLLLMVVMIGLLGIYITHKVAGPVYKMTRLLKQVGEGNLQVDERLRRGDELRHFFDTFTRMVAGLREIEKRQLTQIEAALSAIDQGSKEDVVAALSPVRDAMKRALDGHPG